MKTLERWVLRCSDSDLTWIGFGWLRPEKSKIVSCRYILVSSVVLGLPGILAGIGLLYLVFGTVSASVCLTIIGTVVVFELLLHLLFAHFWNRRARTLAAGL